MTRSVQLLGISNAIVDILAHIDDSFLDEIGAAPGSMTLIDAERAQAIYDSMGPATEMSGGSVGNSIAAFAILGGSAAYIGRVADDQFGSIFAHDMNSLGVEMRLPPETRSAPTARSHILIGPSGQRTMQTYLGACTELEPSDITEKTVGHPEILLLEGYIWDTPQGPAVAARAMEIARATGARIALSLSDDQCVRRHHDLFLRAIDEEVDIVVANAKEIMALLGTRSFDDAVAQVPRRDILFALTRSQHGSIIVRGNERHVIDAVQVDKVIDTTGAGDAYAAGFLFGLLNDKSLPECGNLASVCAAAVIRQVGARLEPGAVDGGN